jgi:hypothetical protein
MSMNLVRMTVLAFGLTLVVGCSGDTPKGAVAPANPAASRPGGATTAAGADGAASDGSSAPQANSAPD